MLYFGSACKRNIIMLYLTFIESTSNVTYSTLLRSIATVDSKCFINVH